jgi:HAD superfamily hydrolase (TIGR01509 family)
MDRELWLMPRSALKAVLFDMDDTLIDWSQRSGNWAEYRLAHLEQVYQYVVENVYPIEAPEAFYEATAQLYERDWMEAYDSSEPLRPPHIGTVLARALQTVGVPPELLNREVLMRAYNWQPVEGVVPFPDALSVLPILRASGLKLGIITNSAQPMWMRDIELTAFGLIDYFPECRLSAADVGYLKPHPAIFETALANLGVTPGEALFIGDNPEADVEGAQRVGMRGVLRSIPARSAEIHRAIVPDAAIDTLHDLLPLLGQWWPDWQPTSPTAAIPL